MNTCNTRVIPFSFKQSAISDNYSSKVSAQGSANDTILSQSHTKLSPIDDI